ncbi:MAG: hypothetical protein ACHREM_07060 [Polyangiales bacterium]
MSEAERSTTSAIIGTLPNVYRQRLASLGAYVRSTIEGERMLRGDPESARLSTDVIAEIELGVLIYALHQFLVAGTRAARSAAQAFVDLGVEEGFAVGRARFTPTSDDTLRGDRIAAALLTLPVPDLSNWIARDVGLRELILELERGARGKPDLV